MKINYIEKARKKDPICREVRKHCCVCGENYEKIGNEKIFIMFFWDDGTYNLHLFTHEELIEKINEGLK